MQRAVLTGTVAAYQDMIVSLKHEAIHAMTMEKTATVRPHKTDPSLIANSVGRWICGWTGSVGWLNLGFIYDCKWLDVLEAYPHTHRFLRWLDRRVPIRMAGLSWLRPGEGIALHQDETTRHGPRVLHIGLIVPADGCVLTVGEEDRVEGEGRWIWFDDAVPHSAINASAEERIILYVKFQDSSSDDGRCSPDCP